MAKRKPLRQVQKEITESFERPRVIGEEAGKKFGGQATTGENRGELERVLSDMTQLEKKLEKLILERHRRIPK